MASETQSTWSPSPLFVEEGHTQPYSIILLNQAISKDHELLFETLWRRASLRICADGAANRLYDTFQDRGFVQLKELGDSEHLPHDQGMIPPDEIVGDLDSLSNAVRTYFASKGSRIVTRPSQYATDLQKSIKRVEEYRQMGEDHQPDDLVIYGGLSGRFDQTAHTLHVLWQVAEGVPNLQGVVDPVDESQSQVPHKRKRTWVVNDNSLTWLLPPGKHILCLSRAVMGKTCGILPLGTGPAGGGALVTTSGLEWDLDGSVGSHLGGLLSTSNHLARDDGEVQLECNQPIYWTVELKTDADRPGTS